jgi:hypothetical protein
MLRMTGSLLTILAFGISPDVAHAADAVQIVVRTHIDSPDPQAGMKSEQTVMVNFKTGRYSSSFKTGITSVVGVRLESVRNKFNVDKFSLSNGIASFEVYGETASGVLFFPNINYKFKVSVDRNGKGTLSGCHDGYPSYDVLVTGKPSYTFTHGHIDLIKLFGSCDINVPTQGL